MTGAAAGLVFGASAVFVEWFGVDRMRSVFLNVTEDLVEFVTFGLPRSRARSSSPRSRPSSGSLGRGSA